MSYRSSFTVKSGVKWYSELLPTEKLLLIIIVLLFIGSLIKSAYYTLHYGGTDLRVRVVGARLLNTSHSPYFYKWSPGDPETLLNPNDKQVYINGVSVAPGSLYVQSILAGFNYQSIRIAWTILQYVFALYIFFFVFTKPFKNEAYRIYCIAVGTVFFLCSGIWFMNIERGQIYTFYAFLFCVIYQLLENRNRWMQGAGGFILAVAVYCRPTFAVLLLPLAIHFRKNFALGFLFGAIALGTHAFLDLQLWKDYFSAIAIYTGLAKAPIINTQIPIVYPQTIEGCKNLLLYRESYSAGGIYPIYHYLQMLYPISNWFYILLYIVVTGLLIFLFRKSLRLFSNEEVLLFGFLLYIITEYLIPANRAGYNVVQWIFPVLLMLRRMKFNEPDFLILITGLALMISFPYYLPFLHDVGELGLVYCLVRRLRDGNEMKPFGLRENQAA